MAEKTVTRKNGAAEPLAGADAGPRTPTLDEFRAFLGIADEQPADTDAEKSRAIDSWRKQLVSFRLPDEEAVANEVCGDTSGNAALVFNPEAAPSAFVAAAICRAEALQMALQTWSNLDDDILVNAAMLARMLEGQAHDVVRLLEHLACRLAAEPPAAKAQG